jgi:uncharacterized membrane protein (UPF0127 family)
MPAKTGTVPDCGRVLAAGDGRRFRVRILSRSRVRNSAFCLLHSAFCILLLLSCGPSAPRPSSRVPRPSVPTAELRIKDSRLFAEVVSRPEDRNLGLMFRRSLAPDSGMLFVFEEDEVQRFWMKNTLIPLSIAYITRDSLITDILEMATLDTMTPYVSSRPVRYALEMNSGWFQSKGIKPGDTVRGLAHK